VSECVKQVMTIMKQSHYVHLNAISAHLKNKLLGNPNYLDCGIPESFKCELGKLIATQIRADGILQDCVNQIKSQILAANSHAKCSTKNNDVPPIESSSCLPPDGGAISHPEPTLSCTYNNECGLEDVEGCSAIWQLEPPLLHSNDQKGDPVVSQFQPPVHHHNLDMKDCSDLFSQSKCSSEPLPKKYVIPQRKLGGDLIGHTPPPVRPCSVFPFQFKKAPFRSFSTYRGPAGKCWNPKYLKQTDRSSSYHVHDGLLFKRRPPRF